MALSLRKDAGKGSVGLDIDGGFLAAVQASNGRVQRAASMELAPGVVSDGEVADGEALAAAIKTFFKDNGMSRNVRLGVSNQQIVVRQMELPRIEDEHERSAAVRFQAADAIAMPLDEVVLDHQVAEFTRSGDGVERMQVIVVAARRSMVAQLNSAARAGGLRPEGIDLDAFALIRALHTGAAEDEAARVYCHLGGVTNLAVAVGCACLFTRPLSAAWDGEDAAATASELADQIRLSINYYGAQPAAREVAEVVLSGPGSQREGLAAALAADLGLRTTVADPLPGLDAGALPAGEDPHRYTVAAGLAMGAGA